MAELSEGRRDKLKKSQFGMPGSRKYPMPDKSHEGQKVKPQRSREGG
jgi:hypothetical protein